MAAHTWTLTLSPGRLVGALSLALAVFVGMALAQPTQAAITGCRSDPLITLSNGMVVDMSATITDTATDVQGITYTLHGPKNTTVVTVDYGTDPFAALSHFSYVADDAASSYDSYTLVTTGSPGIAVTAYTSATGPQGQTKSLSVTGQSGQTLHTQAVVVIKK